MDSTSRNARTTSGLPLTLRTERLLLRPLAPAHAGEMVEVLGDPALYTFTGGAPPSYPELAARYLRLAAGSPDPDLVWGNWVLQLRATERLVGTVQATVGPLDASEGGAPCTGGRSVELAWIVGTPWQRRGLAREAARALRDALAAGPLGLRAAVAHLHPDHAASAAVAASLGMRPAGVRAADGEVRWRVVLG